MKKVVNKYYVLGLLMSCFSPYSFPIPLGIIGIILGVLLLLEKRIFKSIHVISMSIICSTMGVLLGQAVWEDTFNYKFEDAINLQNSTLFVCGCLVIITIIFGWIGREQSTKEI